MNLPLKKRVDASQAAIGALVLCAVVGCEIPHKKPDSAGPAPSSVADSGGSPKSLQLRFTLPNGEKESQDSNRQFGFWTPSKETALDFKDHSTAPGEKHQWQVGPGIENTVEFFGDILSGRRDDDKSFNWGPKWAEF